MKVARSLKVPGCDYVTFTLDECLPRMRITHVVCDGERYEKVFCSIDGPNEITIKGSVDLTGKEVSFEDNYKEKGL